MMSESAELTLLNDIKTNVSKGIMCIFKEKLTIKIISYCFQLAHLMKSYLPPDRSFGGHVYLSLRNIVLENNLSVLSLAYHLISSPIGHLI